MKKIINSILRSLNLRLVKANHIKNVSSDLGYISAKETVKTAQNEGISLNQAVLRLLRKGAGLSERKETPDVVGSSLDHFIGTWSAMEAEEIERAIADFEEIDETMWK